MVFDPPPPNRGHRHTTLTVVGDEGGQGQLLDVTPARDDLEAAAEVRVCWGAPVFVVFVVCRRPYRAYEYAHARQRRRGSHALKTAKERKRNAPEVVHQQLQGGLLGGPCVVQRRHRLGPHRKHEDGAPACFYYIAFAHRRGSTRCGYTARHSIHRSPFRPTTHTRTHIHTYI